LEIFLLSMINFIFVQNVLFKLVGWKDMRLPDCQAMKQEDEIKK